MGGYVLLIDDGDDERTAAERTAPHVAVGASKPSLDTYKDREGVGVGEGQCGGLGVKQKWLRLDAVRVEEPDEDGFAKTEILPPLAPSFSSRSHHPPPRLHYRHAFTMSSIDTSGSDAAGGKAGGAEEKKEYVPPSPSHFFVPCTPCPLFHDAPHSSTTPKPHTPLKSPRYSLGNKAYMAKKYDEAIARYSEAIELDPDSHIYYSNRSACHGAKGDWASAAVDAKTCLDKDPMFLKGYYRLTMAQMEMKDFGGALETIKAGLKRQPDNAELQKQLRLVKAKKNAADYVRHADSTGTAGRGMSGEELTEVQEQYIAANKELKEVRSKGVAAAGEKRRNELCLSELGKVSEETRLFNSVGKMFVSTPRAQVVSQLEGKVAEAEQRATDLEARHAYLEAKISSHEAILKEAARAGGASA